MDKLISIFKTDTLKKSSITFTGSLINGALGALFFVFTARFLGPVNFALMTVSITVMTLVIDISDMGVDTGLVRFVGRHASDDKKAFKFLKLALKVKLLIGSVMFLIGAISAPIIANAIFGKPELVLPLRVISLGILGGLLFDFATHSLQSYQKFVSWSALFVGTNTIRLLIILVLIGLGALGLENTLAVYVLMPFVGFIISMFILPKGFLKVKGESEIAKEFFHYNKWVALMTVIAATSSRLDTFITARLLPLDQVGIYSAANQLVKIVPQLAGALGTVIAPKMAGKNDLGDMVKYLKKSQTLVGLVVVAGVMFIPFASFFIPIFYGPSYLASVPVFIVLLTAMLVFLFSIPIHNAIFYFFSRPKLFFYLAIGHILIIATLGYYLTDRFGAIGAAFSVLAGSIFNFIIPSVWVYRQIKK